MIPESHENETMYRVYIYFFYTFFSVAHHEGRVNDCSTSTFMVALESKKGGRGVRRGVRKTVEGGRETKKRARCATHTP